MLAPLVIDRENARPERAGSAATLVVGLGETGLACVRWLRACGVVPCVADSRAAPPGLGALAREFPEVEVTLGGFDPERFARAACIVLSPGVPLAEPAVRRARAAGVPVLGDVELFARAARAPVVAITGSNGKSTVTSLVGEMARAAGRDARVGGNLGPPALALLAGTEPDLYVLELSSFQLETTESLAPAVAAVLNVSPDHMDRYPGLAAYVAAKRRILRGARAAVLNLDDPAVAAMHAPGAATLGFTLGTPRRDAAGVVERDGVRWLAFGDEPLMPAGEVRLAGRHNLANVLAAFAIGRAAGLAAPAMAAAARAFAGLAHRCEPLGERDGVRWYNDSKGTNVGATVAAIEGFAGSGPVVLVAGGDGKGADFAPLATAAAGRVRAAVLFGRDAHLLERVLAPVTAVARADGLEGAVESAARLARPGDVVLFSPACASWDMFADYRERGEAFRAAVRARLEA